MYQFLCLDANTPPSNLDVLWPSLETGLEDEEGNMFNENFRAKLTLRKNEIEEITRATSTNEMEEAKDIETVSVGEAEVMYDRNTAEGGVVSTISLEAFDIIKVIGKGSFGKVFLVRYKAFDTFHALKVLVKEDVFAEHQVEQTRTERNVLQKFHHPFIVGLAMAFQTKDKLFFVLDYAAGGELFYQLSKVGRFSHERSLFYAAQITQALEHIHSFKVIYRYCTYVRTAAIQTTNYSRCWN
jgi:hypothetical protein